MDGVTHFFRILSSCEREFYSHPVCWLIPVINAILLHVLNSLIIVVPGSIRIIIWIELQKHEILVLKESCPVLSSLYKHISHLQINNTVGFLLTGICAKTFSDFLKNHRLSPIHIGQMNIYIHIHAYICTAIYYNFSFFPWLKKSWD